MGDSTRSSIERPGSLTGVDGSPLRFLLQQHAIHERLTNHDHSRGASWHAWRNGGTAMNRAKIYSNHRGMHPRQLGPTHQTLKTYLPETERQCVIGLREIQKTSRQPYPCEHGGHTNRHEEHEWKPPIDSSPIR